MLCRSAHRLYGPTSDVRPSRTNAKKCKTVLSPLWRTTIRLERSVLCSPSKSTVCGVDADDGMALSRGMDCAERADKTGSKRIISGSCRCRTCGGGAEDPADAENSSDVETDVNDVAVLHQVVASLDTHLPFLSGTDLAAAIDEVPIRDHFGANEPLHEVGVNLP